MNKFWKKTMVMAALMSVLSVGAFAYDVLATSQLSSTYTRDAFLDGVSESDFDALIYNMLVEGLGQNGLSLERFFYMENTDDEENQVMGEIEGYLKKNFRIGKGSTFMTMVKRGNMDGWVVMSNFSSKNECGHVIYYFNAQ